MKHRIYEVDAEGYLHDGEDSEDVMDLDETHVLNFIDPDHEFLAANDRQKDGRGFYEILEEMLTEEELGLSDEELERLVEESLQEAQHEG